ncbi:amidohydrolase family protein [Caulobacter segnis]|uniref:amidohydrolase family protein n=1 Tax=Caulobacter segnis TaxID=88688 RepID=UPI00240EC083|nr:amidohydrolase family protein [Caulobacter segnis]MDG2522941.1 amidohydrolase family protein [Caulobacter segnis]
MRLLALCAAGACLLASSALAQPVAITNARLITVGPKGVVEDGVLVFEDGVIKAVGDARTPIPADARRIDVKGSVVTPGIISADGSLGLSEVGSVDGAADNRTRTPGLGAAFDIQYALNPESLLIPLARSGGVTRAVVSGHAGGPGLDGRPQLFSGQAALISLDPATRLDVRPKVAMSLDIGEAGAAASGGSRAAELIALRAAFEDVRLFQKNRAAYERGELRSLALSQADLEALIPVLDGRQRLVIGVSRASDIEQALRLAAEYRLKIVLSGAEEGWQVARQIAAAKVPVIVDPLANLPGSFEQLGATLYNAARLQAAGVEVVVGGGGSAGGVRDLRYNAGIAVARGLSYDKAIEGLTLATARTFGVADKLGSLEPGKIADIVVWSGDPFQPASAATAVFIAGREQSQQSRVRALRDRYLKPQP